MTNAKEFTGNENAELTNEVAVTESKPSYGIQSETDEFIVIRDEDGNYKRKAKYQEYNSVKTVTREEKIWLANLIDNDEDTGNGLKNQNGKEIVVADVITRKYDKVNEKTGELEYGVLTYLITPEREAFVTSSKGVYFSIMQYMKLFGTPDSADYENLVIKVGKKKMTNGDSITIKLVG